MSNDAFPILVEKFKGVFTDGLGTVKTVMAKLSVKESARSKFCKPRSIPIAMKAAVEPELERLEKDGVLEKVNISEWAAPIVTVLKNDGWVWIYGDYKVAVNSFLDVDQ